MCDAAIALSFPLPNPFAMTPPPPRTIRLRSSVSLLLAWAGVVHAALRLPAHLSDGAILQTWRGYHVATHLYGTAAPHELVTVTCSVPKVPPFTATADESGAWALAYNWPPGPTDWDDFDLTFTGSVTPAPITLRGVRWGDVVVCLGDGAALLPTSLSSGGAEWLGDAHVLKELSYARLFPAAPPGGSCTWGGAAGGAPCNAWTNATVAGAAAGFSAACLQTAVEATLARGFAGNTVVGVMQLAVNASAVEEWLPPAGVAALAACPPLPGGPAVPGQLWASLGAPTSNFPPRYAVVALSGASDAARLRAAPSAAAAADAYVCRLRALTAGLRSGPRVGDFPVLFFDAAAAAATDGETLWALRAAQGALLPSATGGVGAVVLASSTDAGAAVASNAGGGKAPTNTLPTAQRAAAALAYTAWWAFSQPPPLGPAVRAATPLPGGGATVAFAPPSPALPAASLALVPAPGC